MPTRPTDADQFDSQTAFAALLDRRPEVDLGGVLAEIAIDLDSRHHTFDFATWLDTEAAALLDVIVAGYSPASDPVESAIALFEAIGGRYGLGRREADYRDYRSSVVRHVVGTGRGLPIVLCVIAAELGRRVGLPLQGVSTPGHFLLRLDTPGEPLFFDAYRGGWLFTADEATDWLARTTGYPRELIVPSLTPASPRLIVIRILENLKRQLLAADDWFRAYPIQTRLLALRPGQRGDQIDLAAIAAHGPNPVWALDTLGQLAPDATPTERQRLLAITEAARQSLVRLN